MNAEEPAGGSYRWWPPQRDHVFLFEPNPVRFDCFDRFVAGFADLEVAGVRFDRRARAAGGLPLRILPRGALP